MAWAKTKRRRQILFEMDPHCYWCGVEVFMPPDGSRRLKGKTCHRVATLDHLRSRWHPQRAEPNPMREERTVLSCWKCNNDRNTEEQLALPKEERWRRSGCYPQSMQHAVVEQASAAA